MWGNLADRLAATDINATLEKIGKAVAPREDGEDYDDEEEYEDDEDYDGEDYEDVNGNDDEGIINKFASPFRLAGMVTLDDRRPENEEDHHDNDDDDYEEEEIVYNKTNQTVFTEELFQKDTEILIDGDKNDAIKDHPNEETNTIRGTSQEGNYFGKVSDPHQDAELVIEPITTGICQENSQTSKEETNRQRLKSNTPKEDVKTTPVETNIVEDIISTTSNIGNDPDHKNDFILKQPIQSVIPKEEIYQTSPDQTQDSTKVNHDDVNKIADKLLTSLTPVVAEKFSQTTTATIERVKNKINDDAKQINQKNITSKGKDAIIKNQMTKTASRKINEEESLKFSSRTGGGNMKGRGELVDGDSKSYSNGSPLGEHNKLIEETTPLTTNRKEEITPEPPILDRCGSQNATDEKLAINVTTDDKQDGSKPMIDEETNQEKLEAEFNCNELQIKLDLANQQIEALRSQSQRDKEKAEVEKEDLISQFHSKEARLFQATSEENQTQMLLLEQEFSVRFQNLEQLLAKEQKESQDEQVEYKKLLRESYSNVEKLENEIVQEQQRGERALRKVDDRVAQTMAILDEKDEEISRLKKSIRSMESKVSEHQEGEEEAEDELEELHQENDSLRQVIENLQLETKKLKDELMTSKSGSEELSGLRMELTMLKEENIRERTKKQSVVDSAMSSRTQIESQRDTALSELRDAKQQLAAALGDLEISRSDNSRMMTANNNLQSALEAFQDEREAEMEMIDEQRREAENVFKSANATATSALRQIHEAEMDEIQKASDTAVKNVMHEMELLEDEMKKLKSENNQMRRSLDEAIHRLQNTQEDVIDRNVMKNILVDWCTLNDKRTRQQVLQIMANLLHFSEEEREKVHLTSRNLDSVGAKVVGALAAPFPQSKTDVEHLEGSNVHEKWVNFLMAETDDG